MIAAARVAAAIDVLDLIRSGAPAEKTLTTWGRTHRFAGSGDRLAIRDLVYDALRCRRSLAALGGGDTGRGLMIGLMRRAGQDPAVLFTGLGHAPAVLGPADEALPDQSDAQRLDVPDWLYPMFAADLGADVGPVLRQLQSRANVFLRVNLRRADRSGAMAMLLRDGVETIAHPKVKTALQVSGTARQIQQSAAYLDGLVELQDAASQAAVLRLPLQPGQRVLDYCAGGGGKALAIAAIAEVTVVAHDADPRRMADLPARAARAGVSIATAATAALVQRLPFDLVLVDAPCSGSGTWRRTPDAKWRLTAEALARLGALQAAILAQAAAHVRPGGLLAYATCSVLRAENQAQIQGFTAAYPDWALRDEMQLLPTEQGDGFYLALLQRQTKQPEVATNA